MFLLVCLSGSLSLFFPLSPYLTQSLQTVCKYYFHKFDIFPYPIVWISHSVITKIHLLLSVFLFQQYIENLFFFGLGKITFKKQVCEAIAHRQHLQLTLLYCQLKHGQMMVCITRTERLSFLQMSQCFSPVLDFTLKVLQCCQD